jgi:hypothetical protein
MRDLQGSEITFAVVGGVFGVGRLATMLKGQWIRDGSGLGTSATGLTFEHRHPDPIRHPCPRESRGRFIEDRNTAHAPAVRGVLMHREIEQRFAASWPLVLLILAFVTCGLADLR